eukprot:gene18898-21499_t
MGGSGDPPVFFWLSNETIVSIFSFMGGFVDAVSYMKLFGIFTTMVTGNIIAASTTGFREGDESAIVRVLITAVFAAGIFTSSSLYLILRHIVKINRWTIGMVLFSCEALALAIATIVGVYLEYKASGYPHVGSWQVLLIAGLLSWAMGIHCAATQDVIPNCPSTTMMTMNIAKTTMLAASTFQYYLTWKGMYLYDGMDSPHILEKLTESKKHLLERVEQIVIFAAGVIAGAVLAEHIGFFSIALPTALIVATVVNIKVSQMEHFKRQAQEKEYDVVVADATEAGSNCGL